MDTDACDHELITRLKRLDASGTPAGLNFNYEALIGRHAAKQSRARRRLAYARGTASALVIALVGASLWRFDQPLDAEEAGSVPLIERAATATQPRIVRADTWLAVAALEDHIASLDEALNVAHARGGSVDVARLERTRAELFDSYTQVRYAELVSANF